MAILCSPAKNTEFSPANERCSPAKNTKNYNFLKYKNKIIILSFKIREYIFAIRIKKTFRKDLII